MCYHMSCHKLCYRASVEGMLSVVTRILAAQDMGFVEKMRDIVSLWKDAYYEELRSKEETCALLREEVE